MKRLLIMRHAKSDYPPEIADDFHRPLNRRGRKDVPRMARLLTSYDAAPERILSSTALRARETATAMAELLGLSDAHTVFEDDLYLASADELLSCLHRVEQRVDSLMVIAHNPGLEAWVSQLCGCRLQLPTAAIAALSIDTNSWSGVDNKGVWMEWFVVPRLLQGLELRATDGRTQRS
jgi:phosphohistidine phosphatase